MALLRLLLDSAPGHMIQLDFHISNNKKNKNKTDKENDTVICKGYSYAKISFILFFIFQENFPFLFVFCLCLI